MSLYNADLLKTSKLTETDPYHIYYDLSVLNNDVTGTNAPVSLVFNETRNFPYLTKPNQYFCSLVRFSLETPSLPVFIPQVQLNQTNVNNTIYSITLKYQTFEFQQFIQWVPQDVSQPIPNAPLDVQDFTSEYYFCYNQQYWIELINNAFQSAVTGLNALVPLPTTIAPFIKYNTGGICELYADSTAYDKSLATPIEIYFNASLYTLFSSFSAIYQGYKSITNGKNYLMDIYADPGNINVVALTSPSSYNAIKMTQEHNTETLWSPISALVFTTSLLPVSPSLTGVPKVWNSYSNLLSSGNNSNVTSILTDLEVQDGQYRPNVLYIPEPEYRLFDLNSDVPLSGIEISCFWRTTFGALIPFKLNPQCSGSLKLMFRRKDFNFSKE
jgi:hypothetical protein